MKNIVVLASGNGSNLQAIIDAVESGTLEANIAAVISDRKDSGALERANRHGIPAIVMLRSQNNRDTYFILLHDRLRKINPDLIVLAGFMKIMPAWLVEKFPMRIINLHPSLLPCFGGPGFYGHRVHEKVIESGAKITGCTVHFVTPDVDSGPIVFQKAMEVHDDDDAASLAERLSPLEHSLIVDAVNFILSGEFEVVGNRVIRKTL